MSTEFGSSVTDVKFIKSSVRTVRQACASCGTTDLYWFHKTTNGCDDIKCGDKSHFRSVNATAFTRGMSVGQTHVDPPLHRVDGACRKPDGSIDIIDGEHGSGRSIGDQSTTTSTLVEESRTGSFTFSGGDGTRDESKPSGMISDPRNRMILPDGSTVMADDAAELARIMERMVGKAKPALDVDQVRVMIKEEVAKINRPRTVVVERATGERVEIENGHADLPVIIQNLLDGEDTLMVGPAGTGKSTIARHAAKALGVAFSCLPLCPVSTKADLVGFIDATGTYRPSLFRLAYEHGGLFLFDEIDAAHAGVLCLLNDAIASGSAGFPDGMINKSSSFFVLGAANTFKGADRMYVGRNQLDAATLDRWAFETIEVDQTLEEHACLATGLDAERVKEVLTFVRARRESAAKQGMRVIVSPRASIGMCRQIRGGKSLKKAAESRLYKGMSAQDRSKLHAGM